MSSSEHRDFRPEQSSGSLRFKISLSKQEMEHEEPESASSDPPFRTSYSLYVVLSEIHRLCVKRDHKGIFANPVTEDIAPDYFSIISHPMDLGTIHSRLESRNYYSTAGQYSSDVRLMCENAMCYNPPDTIYYQKARKLLAFVEKQMAPHNLRKLSAELLKMSRPLTDEEIGGQFEEYHHHHHHHHHHHNQQQQVNRYRQDSQNHHFTQSGSAQIYNLAMLLPSSSTARYSTVSTGTIFTPPKLQEEEEIEEVDLLEDEEEERERMATESSPSPALSVRKRRPSSASISSVSKLPRYSSSPPLLVPEVDDSVGRVDSPLTQSTCGRNDSDVVTIDLEATEIDLAEAPLTLSPTSSSISSSTLRGSYRKSKRRVMGTKVSVSTPPPRPLGSSKSRRRNGFHPSASPLPDRIYSEDTWTFSCCLTDQSNPAEVITQVKHAARAARAKFLSRYGRPGHQTIVYLDTSEPGKIYAKSCGESTWMQNGEEGENEKDQRKLVDYPLALRQLLTPKPQSTGQGVYHGLVEQMTSQQVATLHALSKLRYHPAEPVGMGIHGPLAIFEKAELAQLCDAYGGDAVTMESVLSLLTFVEPLGEWGRRWAHQRMDGVTDGYHGKMLLAFGDPTSEFYPSNWMKKAKLTIDPNVLEEFRAGSSEEEKWEEEAETSQASVHSTENLLSSPNSSDLQTLEVDPTGSGHMSMAKMPSNTSTTNTTVKQMATVQPLQRLVSPSCTSSDDKSIASNTLETSTTEAEKESEDDEEVEDEEGGTFDILSAALDASVTPAVSEQMPQQQQSQQQQYVLTTYCMMESGATSAVLEASGNPAIGTNPLAASVNDIAQISALTAAISPIQTLPTLSATCIGLPASVTGKGGCSSSTLLVVDQKIGRADGTLDESLPLELDLEPSSEESPKDSASEGSPPKGLVEGEEEAAGAEGEGILLEVAAELPNQGPFKSSSHQVLFPSKTFQNSASLKVSHTFIDVVTNSAISSRTETHNLDTDESEFPVDKALLETSEVDISSKLDTNKIEKSYPSSKLSKETSPQTSALKEPDDSVSSEMDTEPSAFNHYPSIRALECAQAPNFKNTDILGIRESEVDSFKESVKPLSLTDAHGIRVSMESPKDSTVKANLSSGTETLKDSQSSYRAGLDAPVVKVSDHPVTQESPATFIQGALEGPNLKEIQTPPLQENLPNASNMKIGFCAIEDSLNPCNNMEIVSRESVPEIEDQIATEKSQQIPLNMNPGGDTRPSEGMQSCAVEVHSDYIDKEGNEYREPLVRKWSPAVAEEPECAIIVKSPKAAYIAGEFMNEELLKEISPQPSDSMGVTPHSSSEANHRIFEESVLVDNESEHSIVEVPLKVASMADESLEQALVRDSSTTISQNIGAGVKSPCESLLQTPCDVKSSVNLLKSSITEVTNCVKPEPVGESSSKTHCLVQLHHKEVMDIPTPLPDEVDYDCDESSKYGVTDRLLVGISRVNSPVALDPPNHSVAPFPAEVGITRINATSSENEIPEPVRAFVPLESSSDSPNPTGSLSDHGAVKHRVENQVQMDMDVDVTPQSHPYQYEVNEAEPVSFFEENLPTETCTSPHFKSINGGSEHNKGNNDLTSASDLSSPTFVE
ncbi:unnamed protein product [Hydatigera taeniaeformis]|uniref:Bromo domain-containing protein n=1 Tax=Hydatigena taeniaeformis TaxID=6205 RepID=A0A0R3WZ81_HYDTA|nr:unnamed protein product [Hydatigera taeniaeformis]